MRPHSWSLISPVISAPRALIFASSSSMEPSGVNEMTAPPLDDPPASSRALSPIIRPSASISLQSASSLVIVRPSVSR